MVELKIHSHISHAQEEMPNQEVLFAYNREGEYVGFTSREEANKYFWLVHNKYEVPKYAIGIVTAFCFSTSPEGGVIFFSSIKKKGKLYLESKTIAGHSIAPLNGDENMIKEGYEETRYNKRSGLTFSINNNVKYLSQLEKREIPSLVFINESVLSVPRTHNETGKQYIVLEKLRFYLGYMPYNTRVHNNEHYGVKKTRIAELENNFIKYPNLYTPGLIYLWNRYRTEIYSFIEKTI